MQKTKNRVARSKMYIPKWGILFCIFFLLTTSGCTSLSRVTLNDPVECITIPSYVEGIPLVAKVGEDMITIGRGWSRIEHKVRAKKNIVLTERPKSFRSEGWTEQYVPVDTLSSVRIPQATFLGALMYTGIEGSIMHLNYRETGKTEYFSPHSVDLRYDLEDGHEIKFRSLNIQVRNATSTIIEFTVTDDGGLPWLPNPAELGSACN